MRDTSLPCTPSTANAAAAEPGQVNRRSMLAGLGGLAAIGGLAGCGSGSEPAAPAATGSASAVPSPPRAKCTLVLLGTQAGPPIQPDRTGIASALVVDGRTYVIDCGRSAATQYVRAGLRERSLAAIFLTHLHADHIADYYNFFMLGANIPNTLGDIVTGPVAVYGPGPAGGLAPAFGGAQVATVAPADPTPGTARMTAKAIEAYAYSSNLFMRDSAAPDVRDLVQVHEISVPSVGASYLNRAPTIQPFPVMRDDRVSVTATLVPHGPVFPAFAYRFDTAYGSVTFSGDTTRTPNLIALAKNTDILVHEAINVQGAHSLSPAAHDHMLQSHVMVQDVGPIAQQAQAKKLVLSHIGDLAGPLDMDKWTSWARTGYDGPVTVGADLQHFVIA